MPGVVAGLVIGVITTMVEISFAGIIFRGELSSFLASGITLMLFGAVGGQLIYTLISTMKIGINLPQDTPVALLGAEVAALTGGMWGRVPAETIFFTVVGAIMFTTMLTGVMSYLLGRFKLGSLVRYLPYPVVGGFLAGTGWLLFLGGLEVTAGTAFDVESFFMSGTLMRWLPGVVFAVLLYVLIRRVDHFLAMPAAVIAAIALFFLVANLNSLSVEHLSATGYLLGPFSESEGFKLLTLDALQQAEWGTILGHTLHFGSLVLISIISLLLNVSALDLAVKDDVDLNVELRSSGLTNLAMGALGTSVSYPTLSLSVLAARLGGGRNRLPVVVSTLVPLTVLLFGTQVVALMPRMVFGGLIMFLGISFLYEWLVDVFLRLSIQEYGIVWVILISMATLGVLPAVGIGMLMSALVFVFNYARINVIKHVLPGNYFHSTVDRPMVLQRLLSARENWMKILMLHGYIFFGTAGEISQALERLIAEDAEGRLRYLLIDFRDVSGMDASAALEFQKMQKYIDDLDVVIVLTELTPRMEDLLERDLKIGEDERWQLFPTLDAGLQWCEDEYLRRMEETGLMPGRRGAARGKRMEIEPKTSQLAALKEFLGKKEKAFNIPLVKPLEAYLTYESVGAGVTLIEQGEDPSGLFFIEDGEASVYVDQADGERIRLRRMMAGTVVGEVSYYNESLATATVITDTPCEVYVLSEAVIARIDQEMPGLAAELHRYMAQLLSYRLSTTTNTIRALVD
jgi:SulP family sulfate permease